MAEMFKDMSSAIARHVPQQLNRVEPATSSPSPLATSRQQLAASQQPPATSTSNRSARLDAVLFHQAIEGIARDAEVVRGAADDPVVPLEGVLDLRLGVVLAVSASLSLLRGRPQQGRRPRGLVHDFRRQQVDRQSIVPRAGDHPSDDELELPDVAGPWIATKGLENTALDTHDRLSLF